VSAVEITREGDACVVTLNRPETHNALDRATGEALAQAIEAAGRDPEVRAVILTGAGDRTFLSGGDLNMLADMVARGEDGAGVVALGEALAACERSPVPVLAAAQGDVYGGGCEVLLLCDLVVMESHAGLAFRHARMGLAPAWGGLTRLVERVGPLEAARLLFTAERIDAAEARSLGLVNEVVPKGAAKARALELVRRIAENPRATVAALKRGLREVREARRGEAIEKERAVFGAQWGGADHRAAMQAHLAKRQRAER
jgi:enoyl-CoA hydratase